MRQGLNATGTQICKEESQYQLEYMKYVRKLETCSINSRTVSS